MATQSEVCGAKGNESEQMTAMQSVECRDPRGHSANVQPWAGAGMGMFSLQGRHLTVILSHDS